MRLTLRTMLAYLDDVLEPADAAILGEKIKESEFASKLVSRIRTAVSQQRLSAPPVDGKGIGQDANSVAEYLDSTLPHDRVPDFERICLDSDAHLAEVAACHQVLTLVLGKAAAVPPHLRERVYRFGSSVSEASVAHPRTPSAPLSEADHRLDTPHAAESAQSGVDIAAGAAASATVTHPAQAAGTGNRGADREKVEVPEYLREGRRRSRMVALAVSACVLLIAAGIGLVVARQFFPRDDLTQAPSAESNAPTIPVERGESPESTPTETPAADDGGPAGHPAGEGIAGEQTDGEGPATTTDLPAEGPIDPPVADNPPGTETPPPPATADPSDIDERPATIELPPSVEEVPVNEPPATVPPAGVPPVNQPPATVPPATDVAASDVPPPPLSPSTPADPAGTVPATGDPSNTPAEEQPAEDLSPVDIGRFLSGDKVLARLSPDDQWLRLPANTPIRSGDRVLALPAYRPQIALTAGITLTLDGPTRVNFPRPSQENQPHVNLRYGKLLAFSVAKDGSTMEFTLGDVSGTVRLADTDTMLAVEAIPVRAAGSNPETREPQLDIHIICLAGRIDWIGSQGNAVAIAAGEQLSLSGAGVGQITKFAAPPAWVDDKTTSLPDRDAARMLEQRLVADRPLTLTLIEEVNGPRGDLRSLAVRSLAYLDNHSQLISALNDDSQRSAWSAEFDAVGDALARGPAAAAEVRKALEKERGASAKELYRMLWGYSQEDLAAGADAKLVEHLDHDSQEFRVLAIENLRRITGATHLYRPEYNPQRRRMYVQTWRRDLEEGKIRYPEPAAGRE